MVYSGALALGGRQRSAHALTRGRSTDPSFTVVVIQDPSVGSEKPLEE